ncbi:M28 family peptidase [Phytohabitans sp. ZYX-F-186]|uniref:M28 family peptidase n=1 Tax=Phytohabitans maris TaxID=3071409 RepID=A0ABU0ZAU0_9ACTN|nr:M28 family peptidase [Phytohabitans sp. ZYX-F-186]MDQ7903470.1 M28 family peptidase [Phytohabitans sp. ZYX-F-186]
MVVDLERPADRALTRPRRRGLSALAAVAALVAVGAITLLDLRPPEPRPADAPAAEFSAGRAYPHVAALGAHTHVAGSAANDRNRERIEATLRDLGLSPAVQDTVGTEAGQLSGGSGGATFARVRNVVATLPGTDSTGRVFLVAHYDSVQVGPGGNDDGAGVATILEVARALTSGPRPRNDVVFVLTDAEEACLCGASAFVSAHPLAANGGVVLNLEARGSGGPVITFETSRRNAGLVNAFGRAAPHPVGTSFAVEVYRLLPNDTDFTPFLDKGFAGLNSAYIDGAAVYHTPLDTPATMDRASLQQHGDNALALAREFGRVDLSTVEASGDATYFPVPGGLARYPGWLTWPLALAALVATAALAWLARRRGRTTWPRVVAGLGLGLVPVLLAPVLAQLLWALLAAIRPGYTEMIDPYRPLWFRLAVISLSAAVLFTWYALLRRRLGPAALAIGGLGWLVVFGLALAFVAPGGSYLAALPALAAALAGILALAVPRIAVVAVTAGAAVATVILVPTVTLLFPALGLAMGAVGALFAVLLGLAALPVVDLLFAEAGGQRALAAMLARRHAIYPGLAGALAAVAFTVTGFSANGFDAEHPSPTHLMYALDAGTGKATWLSLERGEQEWTSRYVSGEPAPLPDFPALGDGEFRTGPAQAAALPAPTVDVQPLTSAPGERHLRLRVRPQRPVRLLSLHVDAATATVVSARVAGQAAPVGREGERWSFGMVFHAPPPEGVEVELVLRPSGGPAGQVSLRVMDGSDGLSGLPGYRPRPPDVGIAGSHTSELVAVATTVPI